MPFITVENHLNVSLISLTIAPSTAVALAVLLFVYLYIIHVRSNPRPQPPPYPFAQQERQIRHDDDNRGAGRPLRRPPFFGRLSKGLRTRKQRTRPAIPPLWLSLPSFWLPFRQRVGDGRIGVGRQIQPASVEKGRKRQPKQRLLEQ